MKASELAASCNAALQGGEAEITSLCTDSRVVQRGDLFFCIPGTKEDGHAYAQEAEARGAAAIVCEWEVDTQIPHLLVADAREALSNMSAAFYGDPQRSLSIIGVTGTNGKTTVTRMLHAIFGKAGKKSGVIGTLGAAYGTVEIPPSLTTPDPIALFSLLAEMKSAGVETVSMEVSAHALALKKELPICYDAAVFTNLTQDHLDFFGDMASYGEAKKSLFRAGRCKCAILNGDDPFSGELGRDVLRLTYGLDEPSDCFALIEEEDLRGSRVLLNLEDELCEASIPLVGRFNISNALAAASCAFRLGADAHAISEGLATVRAEGRLERVRSVHGAEIFVDYAHTPDGLKKALTALREYTEGRLILVFGCGGNRDRGKRPLMGQAAATYADFTVITSDNPRYEDPCAIMAEIIKGFGGEEGFVAIEEREKAIFYAIGLLRQGDVLLVAGKGAERTQEIMGIKYPFHDKTVIERYTE